jgi:hypothetical protein
MYKKGTQPGHFTYILSTGWVNPRITATPFAGYRKCDVSAPALGTIQNRFSGRPPFYWGLFFCVSHFE